MDGEPTLEAPKSKRPPPKTPRVLVRAFRSNPRAKSGWQRLATTYKREYIAWLNNAKRPETQEKRLQETLAALEMNLKWVDRKQAAV